VAELHKDGNCLVGDELLSRAATAYVTSFTGCITNGYGFHTQRHERKLQTQNSGVFVLGNVGAGKENIDYCGVLTDVIRSEYIGSNHVVFFQGNWWDMHYVGRGVKVDKIGFVNLNSKRLLNGNDPFILASQASQVFYYNDGASKGWLIVVKVQP